MRSGGGISPPSIRERRGCRKPAARRSGSTATSFSACTARRHINRNRRRGEIVKTGVVLALIVATWPGMAVAQSPVAPTTEQVHRHEQISLLEGTLVGAVRFAAGRVAKDVQSRTNNTNFFAGEARAKGFTLDGFGVFVYVEVPTLDLTVTLMVDQREREAQRRSEDFKAIGNRGAGATGKDDPVSKDVPITKEPSAKDTLQDIQD